ncbi:DUF4156 domain-containing protein [Methylogaea oryzae]|uniref:DUF4156 domain-containing protein n=1 Tax=Methylogaea oryzae TaxID=1295382 RepID=UPI0020D12509|nr:DUF4156 domain-containing protein [Methylogaea oryzae]
MRLFFLGAWGQPIRRRQRAGTGRAVTPLLTFKLQWLNRSQGDCHAIHRYSPPGRRPGVDRAAGRLLFRRPDARRRQSARAEPQRSGPLHAVGPRQFQHQGSIGFIARSKEAVQEEVNRLSRNNAADMHGDTIVPLGPLIDGEQGFNVYRCINP